MNNDPIFDFFKKLPQVIPGVTLKEEAKTILSSDLSTDNIIFSVDEFNDETWEEIERGVRNIFEPAVVQRTFPATPSSTDGGRGYIVRADPLWFITFSRALSYKRGKTELRCSVQGNRIRPSQ